MPARFGGVSSVDASSTCTLKDMGFTAALTFSAKAWTVYGSGGANHYEENECSFGVTVPSALLRLNQGDLEILSGRFFDRVQQRAGGQIGQQQQLLRSQVGAGVSHVWGRVTLGLDYQHSTSEFGDTTQDGYSLSGTALVWKAVSLKLTLGNTVTDKANAPYIGLYMTAQF